MGPKLGSGHCQNDGYGAVGSLIRSLHRAKQELGMEAITAVSHSRSWRRWCLFGWYIGLPECPSFQDVCLSKKARSATPRHGVEVTQGERPACGVLDPLFSTTTTAKPRAFSVLLRSFNLFSLHQRLAPTHQHKQFDLMQYHHQHSAVLQPERLTLTLAICSPMFHRLVSC